MTTQAENSASPSPKDTPTQGSGQKPAWFTRVLEELSKKDSSTHHNFALPFCRGVGQFVTTIVILALIWAAVYFICSFGFKQWQGVAALHCSASQTTGPANGGSEEQSKNSQSPSQSQHQHQTVKEGLEFAWQGALVAVLLPLAGLTAGTVCTVAYFRREQ